MENWENLNKILLLEQKDVAIKNELSRQLIAASIEGDKILAKKILKKGAFLNCFDEHLTPLIACIEYDKIHLANFYVKANANITYRPNPKFIDAFWYALINKKYEFLEMFVLSRVQLLRHNETNETPLIYSTIKSDVKAVEILLKHSFIKVNERDGEGNTALHHNMSKSNPSDADIDIGKMLLAAGADSNAVNFAGKTAGDITVDAGSRSVLMSADLDKKLPTNELETNNENNLDNGMPSKTKSGKMKI